MKKRVFISHISEEAALAAKIKECLESDFLNLVDVFASSDIESIGAGEPWLTAIEGALRNAAIVVVLCSQESLARPWINFEIGAAWALKVRIVPVCHAGVLAANLPMPLSLLNGVDISNVVALQRLYTTLAQVVGCGVPRRSFDALAADWRAVECALPQSKQKQDAGAHREAGEEAVLKRLHESLNHPQFRWRTIRIAADEAAIGEAEAVRLLRSDSSVRFSRNADGETLVGLKARVGEHKRKGSF